MEKTVTTSPSFISFVLPPFSFLSKGYLDRVHDAVFPLHHHDHEDGHGSTPPTTPSDVKSSTSSCESRYSIVALSPEGRYCFKCGYTSQCNGCPLPDNDDQLSNIYHIEPIMPNASRTWEARISFGVVWPTDDNVTTPQSGAILTVPFDDLQLSSSSSLPTPTKEMIEYHISARPTHKTETNEIIRMDRIICALPKSLHPIVTNHQTILHWKSASHSSRRNQNDDSDVNVNEFGSIVRLRNDQSKCPYNNINGPNRCLCSIQPTSFVPLG
jgi:hypothetical protein